MPVHEEKMTNTSATDVTCAILAGGRSTRMGKDKATLKVCGKTLIEQVYEKACLVFTDVVIVSNSHERFDGIAAPIIRDILPVQSPVVGIVSALLAAKTPYIFALACDMPFVSVESIQQVLNEVRGEDIIVPRTAAGLEPLHAVYSRSCISAFLTRIGMHRLKLTALFPYYVVKEVGAHPAFVNKGISVFTNTNAREDLSVLERFLDR